MIKIINPSAICGELPAPPSKSYAHRMILASALSGGESVIRGVALSRDIEATLDCVVALGASFEKIQESETLYTVKIKGCGGKTKGEGLFPCFESGSTLRFLMPISLVSGGNAVFTGTARLMQRGVGIYEELFRQKGIDVNVTESGIHINGTLPGGDYTLRGDVSSQYVTGLLFSLPLAKADSIITVLPPVESRPYIDITLEVLKNAGINIDEKKPNMFYIKGGQSYNPLNSYVPGDWSNAAALLAFNLIPGNRVYLSGLNTADSQGDKACVGFLKRIAGGDENPIDISATPDLGPILFAAAAVCNGAKFVGTRRLRIKESDRAAVMAQELEKFGISAQVGENFVNINKGELKSPSAPLFGHNDHRIVMAMTFLCSVVGGVIEGCEAVSKSFPDYFDAFSALGGNLTDE